MRNNLEQGDRYEIRVRGHIDGRWSRHFGGLELTPLPGGETVLTGLIPDQSALQGIIARIGDLGLKLLLVRHVSAVGASEIEGSSEGSAGGTSASR